MKVEVTAKHIAKGCRNIYDACPVALALEDAGAYDINIDSDSAVFTHEGLTYTFSLPLEVQAWIGDFDSGVEVEPMNFDIDLEEVPCVIA